jgi:hypothetical protein
MALGMSDTEVYSAQICGDPQFGGDCGSEASFWIHSCNSFLHQVVRKLGTPNKSNGRSAIVFVKIAMNQGMPHTSTYRF